MGNLSPEMVRRLENDFTYHKPFGNQPERYEKLRSKAKELAVLMVLSCPESRELSVALTKFFFR